MRACLGNNVHPYMCKTCLLPKAETGRVAFGFGRRWFSLLGARSFANSGWRRVKLQQVLALTECPRVNAKSRAVAGVQVCQCRTCAPRAA